MAKSKKPSGKYNLTLALDANLARHFNAFCVLKGRTMSERAEQLFRRDMKGYSTSFDAFSEDTDTQVDAEAESPKPGTLKMPRDKQDREAG